MKRTRLQPQSANKRQWRYKYHADQSRRRNAQVKAHGQTFCQRCGEFGAVEGHHPDGQNGALILHYFLIDRKCHDWIHLTNPNAAREEGWLRAKHAPPKTMTTPKKLATPSAAPLTKLEPTVEGERRLMEKIRAKGNDLRELLNLLTEYRDGEYWRLRKKPGTDEFCQSFNDAEPVILEELGLGSRATIFRLMTVADVAINTGETLPHAQAAVLNALPAARQSAVLEQAREAARDQRGPEANVTAADIRAVTTPPAPVAPPPAAGKPERPAPKAKDEWKTDAVREALSRLAKLCGDDVKKAITNGSLGMEPKDVLQWAKLSDEDIRLIDPLVVGKRWKVRKALDFVHQMVSPETTFEDAMNLAIVHGGRFEATVGGFEFTVKAPRRK